MPPPGRKYYTTIFRLNKKNLKIGRTTHYLKLYGIFYKRPL
jgi:hypothetical protein